MTMLKTGRGAGSREPGTGNVLFQAASRVQSGRQINSFSGRPFSVFRFPFPARLPFDITRHSARSQHA